MANWHFSGSGGQMIIRTRVFEIATAKFENLSELARAMGISVSQVYRVREGKRGINEKFIVGAKMAFPDSRLDELFYIDSDQPPAEPELTVSGRYHHIVNRLKGTSSYFG
jgi:hypothetical protein